MHVCQYLLFSNPFFDAYGQSDLLGKVIFIALFALSVACWIILIYKVWLLRQVRRRSSQFRTFFQANRHQLLTIDCRTLPKQQNPLLQLYLVLKKYTLDILNKNRHFGGESQKTPFLSLADIDFVETHLMGTVTSQTQYLEKNLFILATIVSLAPFLGLLGTAWGISVSLSELQMHHPGSTNQAVLGGISLALSTTVLGLLDVIPALIGYNYLKNAIRDIATEMEGFSYEILTLVEMQYRQVDIQHPSGALHEKACV